MIRDGAVSVVIPTRNRVELLLRAIHSALDSGEACGEVVVVDDGSTDDTREAVASISDARVRYFYSDSKGGPAARNRGFREAENDLIKFLDDDDYLLTDGLSRQLAAYRRLDPSIRDQVVLYGDARVTGQIVTGSSRREIASRRRHGETDLEYLIRVNIQTSCPLHQRHLLNAVGGFDESLRASQENDLHVRLALYGARFVRVPGDIYVFDNSSNRNRISTQKRDHRVIEARLSLLLKRLEIVSDEYRGDVPLSIRRSLARDFRECQRWSRRSNFADLEILSARSATSVFAGGPLERNFAGTAIYGLVRRVRSKMAKRIRGLLLSEKMAVKGFAWLSGESGLPVDVSGSLRIGKQPAITNVSVGDVRSVEFSMTHHLSSEVQHTG